MAITYIHQRHLTGLRKASNHAIVSGHELNFVDWLEQSVGQLNKDWGRSYNLSITDPDYGTTWWFRDPAKATLTLLMWS